MGGILGYIDCKKETDNVLPVGHIICASLAVRLNDISLQQSHDHLSKRIGHSLCTCFPAIIDRHDWCNQSCSSYCKDSHRMPLEFRFQPRPEQQNVQLILQGEILRPSMQNQALKICIYQAKETCCKCTINSPQLK